MEYDYSAVGNKSSILFFGNQAHILDNIYIRAGLILVYSIIFLICFIGNLAVILVVTLEWKARLLSKFYLGNMAAANLSVAIFCIPPNVTLYLLDRWIFGELMCRMFHFATSLCQTASILILFVVSMERYMTLVHGFNGHQVLSARGLQVIMLIVWMLSAGVSLPRVFYCGLIRIPLDHYRTSEGGEFCEPENSMYNSATADTIYFVVLYALPLAVMSVLYFRIGARVRKSEKMRTLLIGRHSAGNHEEGQRGHLDGTHIAPSTSSASKSTSSVVSTPCGQLVISTRGLLNQQVKILGRSTCMAARRSELTESFRRLMPGHLAGRGDQPATTASGKYHIGLSRHEVEMRQLRLFKVRRQKRQSLVRMLKSIIITFAMLNLPFHVYKICVNFMPSFAMSNIFNNLVTPLTFVLMYANCAVNPTLYIFMSKRFRRSLRDLIRRFSAAS